MQVRFTAQWLSPDGWVPLAGQASSPWLDAGSAEFTWQQAGWTFALNVPQSGEAYQLRAVAEMKLGSGKAVRAHDRHLHGRRLGGSAEVRDEGEPWDRSGPPDAPGTHIAWRAGRDRARRRGSAAEFPARIPRAPSAAPQGYNCLSISLPPLLYEQQVTAGAAVQSSRGHRVRAGPGLPTPEPWSAS